MQAESCICTKLTTHMYLSIHKSCSTTHRTSLYEYARSSKAYSPKTEIPGTYFKATLTNTCVHMRNLYSYQQQRFDQTWPWAQDNLIITRQPAPLLLSACCHLLAHSVDLRECCSLHSVGISYNKVVDLSTLLVALIILSVQHLFCLPACL